MPTNKTIHLGYEAGSGQPVSIRLHHLVAVGMTQRAGKTTAIEGLIIRSGMPALAFITSIGEKPFSETGAEVPAFYAERSDWQYVEELLESMMGEKMKFERYWINKACKGTRSLREVHRNIKGFLESGKLRGIDEGVYTNLAAYLEIIIPQVEQAKLSSELKLYKGLNVMRLEHFEPELQKLVIASALEHINRYYRGIIVIIPEAWDMLPYKGSPVRIPAEHFIRKGAKIGNYLWMDTQDTAALNRVFLRNTDNWLLGLQKDPLEVDRNLEAIPVEKSLKPKSYEVQQLTLGYFYVCSEDWVKKVYVQPAWMRDEAAQKIAKGMITVEQTIEESKKPNISNPILNEEKYHPAEIFEPAVKPLTSEFNPEQTKRLDNITEAGLQDIIRLGEENQALKKEKEELTQKLQDEGKANSSILEENEVQTQRITELTTKNKELEKDIMIIIEHDSVTTAKLNTYKFFDDMIERIVDQQVSNKLTELETRLTSKLATQQPSSSPSNGETQLIVESNQSELIVKVNRPPVYIDENTLRGQLALIISENLVDEYRSGAWIGKTLKNLGVNVQALSKTTSLFKELDWYTSQRILIHDDARGWKVRDKTRIKAEKQ